MCLESKDTEKTTSGAERSCWCLFRMSVLCEGGATGRGAVHRDSYGERLFPPPPIIRFVSCDAEHISSSFSHSRVSCESGSAGVCFSCSL